MKSTTKTITTTMTMVSMPMGFQGLLCVTDEGGLPAARPRNG
jgi:hypothetical protein